MIPNLDFVNSSFLNFNREIFNNHLPLPRFKLTRARTFHGKLVYKYKRTLGFKKAYDFEMRISTSFSLPEKEWEDVVIHEMIHLFIAVAGIKDKSSHGPEFRKMMANINRTYGRNITISARSGAEESIKKNVDTHITAHYVCIAKMNDGNFAIAPVATTKIFMLWDFKRFFPQISSLRWIGSTSPFFNSFPHVRTPKLYKVTESMLRENLKGSVLLEREGNRIKIVNRRCSPDELLP